MQEILQKFFIFKNIPENAELVFYIPPLVVLSFLTTIMGAYIGLSLVRELFEAKSEKTKKFLHFYSAFVLGAGMWIMHFVGMLSHDMRFEYNYNGSATVILIVAVMGASYAFVHFLRTLKAVIFSYFLCALILALSILIMNYLGVRAMDINANVFYDPLYFGVSLFVAFIFSLASVIFIYQLKNLNGNKGFWMVLTSLFVGVGIGLVHYIMIEAAFFIPTAACCENNDQSKYQYMSNGSIIVFSIFILAILLRLFYAKNISQKENISIWNYIPKIIILLGVVITAIVIVWLYNFYSIQDKTRFLSYVSDTENALLKRYSKYEQALKGGKGLFAASEYVSRDEWKKFTEAQTIDTSLQGINGIGFIEYVEEENLEEFVLQAKKEFPSFKNYPKTSFKDKFVIKYIEPTDVNMAAVGLDIGFEENRREAAETSRVTGKPSLTRKIDLVQDNVRRAGFLLLLPLAEKDGVFKGWVYAPFIGEFFLKELKRVNDSVVAYAVYDGKVIDESNLIYKSPDYSDTYFKGKKTHVSSIVIAGKEWTISWLSTPMFQLSKNNASLFYQLMIGVFITWLLAMVAYLQNARTKMVEKIVDDQTKKLIAERKFSDLIVNTIPDSVFVKDKDFKILRCNEAFYELYPEDVRANLIGTTGIENHRNEEVEEYLAEDKKAFFEGIAQTLETITIHDGSKVTLDTTKVRFENEVGEEFILGIARDVSEMQHAKENLELIVAQRTQELEKANASKDMFLANISHELRTPLNSILGLIKLLLLEENVSSDYKDTLRVIEKSAASLLEIVNDILDLSKIEAEKIDIEYKPFNVSGLMYSLLEMIKPLASQKGLDLRSNVKDLDGINVIGDEFRLSRIILNLASNAIKYTNKGFVDIYIDIVKKDNDKIDFVFNITDTGIGIPEDKINHIFEKFTQAEESTERKFGGTGLGLNITQKLVGLMKGDIKVKSEINKGSTFSFVIPFNIIEISADNKALDMPVVSIKEKNRKPFSEAKILIAEDHKFNQIFVMKLLRQYGCENYDLAMNGIDVVREYQENEYDAILMDCHMPKQNGYTATKIIREMEASNDKHIPIIAMTADAMSGTRDACIEVGMDEYISKPVDIEVFRTVLERWFVFEKSDIESSPKITKKKEKKISNVINLDVLNDYTGGDLEKNKELLTIFQEKSLEDIEMLSKYLIDGKSKEWSAQAHALKGSAAYIGADILYSLSEKAQNMMDASREDREIIYGAIKENHNEICKYLKNKKLLS